MGISLWSHWHLILLRYLQMTRSSLISLRQPRALVSSFVLGRSTPHLFILFAVTKRVCANSIRANVVPCVSHYTLPLSALTVSTFHHRSIALPSIIFAPFTIQLSHIYHSHQQTHHIISPSLTHILLIFSFPLFPQSQDPQTYIHLSTL